MLQATTNWRWEGSLQLRCGDGKGWGYVSCQNLHILCFPFTGNLTVSCCGFLTINTYGDSDSPSGNYIWRKMVIITIEFGLVGMHQDLLAELGFANHDITTQWPQTCTGKPHTSGIQDTVGRAWTRPVKIRIKCWVIHPSTLDFEWSFFKYARSCLTPKTNQKIMKMYSPS